jgi:hypothetical protein
MPRGERNFRLIDPLKPPSRDGEFGRLSSIVVECAVWFFSDPSRDVLPGRTSNGTFHTGIVRSGGPPTLSEIDEAVEAARGLLAEQANRGSALVDRFCARLIAKEPPYQLTLSTGRTIGQRQLLCAQGLVICEATAMAIRERRAGDVCNLMCDLVELVCEIRRTLDREAGSTIAARRARQRHEKTYQMRAYAQELYNARKWPSVLKAARTIYPKVVEFAKSLEGRLSEDRGEQTVYEWLLAYKKTTSAEQACNAST